MFTRRRTGSEAATSSSPTPPSPVTGSPSFVARPVHNSIRPPAAYTRQQHIDSYLKDRQLAPSTRKVSEDDSTFDTVFQSVTGDTLILRVHWPAIGMGMVARPPAMTLAGVEAKHSWLDGRMRVTGYAPIQSSTAWLDAHILLGVAVHEVIQHLQLNPPTIVRFVDAGLVAIQTKSATTTTTTTTAQQQPNNGMIHVRNSQYNNHDPPPPAYNDYMMNVPAEIDLPTIPNCFPELDSCSRDRLEELMRDELEFRAFCNRLPIMTQYYEMEQTVMDENVTTAKKILQSERELKELYAAITALHEELQGKINVFQVLEKKQDLIGKPPDVSKVCRELVKAKKEAFERSERIADAWLESDVCSATTDSFVEEFLVARKVLHTRGAKLELLEGTRRDRLTL